MAPHASSTSDVTNRTTGNQTRSGGFVRCGVLRVFILVDSATPPVVGDFPADRGGGGRDQGAGVRRSAPGRVDAAVSRVGARARARMDLSGVQGVADAGRAGAVPDAI